MNNQQPQCRPFFRVLAAIVAVLGWLAVVLLVWIESPGEKTVALRWLGYIGMTGFAIRMTLAAARGR